jgi:hypothetical protein
MNAYGLAARSLAAVLAALARSVASMKKGNEGQGHALVSEIGSTLHEDRK